MNKIVKSAGAGVVILGLVLGIHIPTPAQTIYATCDSYINIHSSYTLDSQIIGKIYNGNVAQVLSQTTDKYYIASGNVTGWVDKNYFTQQAPEGYTVATVYPQLLNVRSAPSEDSNIYTSVYQNQQIEAINYENGWVTLAFEDGSYGYVDANYVGLNTYYGTAKSTEEEQIEYQQQLTAAQTVLDNGNQENYSYFNEYQEEQNQTSYNGYSYSESNYCNYDYQNDYSSAGAGEETQEASSSDPPTTPATSNGQYLSDYAKQYVGNPYVYGGESLQSGADCSGFTKAVLNANGIQVNGRTAAEQANGGTQVSLSEAQAGDLIYYSNGSGVYHIAIYNGDGTVTHSSSSNTGVIVSDMNYSGNAAGAVRYW